MAQVENQTKSQRGRTTQIGIATSSSMKSFVQTAHLPNQIFNSLEKNFPLLGFALSGVNKIRRLH